MVTHWAHNPKISGSIPLPTTIKCSCRLKVRTMPFHGINFGSSPCRSTNAGGVSVATECPIHIRL